MRKARVGDVIQLDPEHSHGWGPLLCIVDKDWGDYVRCYALVPQHRGEPPLQMPLRMQHGHYVVIGRAEWMLP